MHAGADEGKLQAHTACENQGNKGCRKIGGRREHTIGIGVRSQTRDEIKKGQREPVTEGRKGLGSPLRTTNGQADAKSPEAKTGGPYLQHECAGDSQRVHPNVLRGLVQ